MPEQYQGLTFNNLRKALYYLYFGADYPELEAYKYIIPMQQNFFNPIVDPELPKQEDWIDLSEKLPYDTYIQFFIMNDKRLTQDQFGVNTNYVHKRGDCLVRFVGVHAEMWAKAFHHLTKRDDTYSIFLGTCQAEMLENAGDIVPTQISFNGVNAHIAFDIEFRLFYKESIDLRWLPLKRVTVAPGIVV